MSTPVEAPLELTSELIFRQQAILRTELPDEAAQTGQYIISNQTSLDNYTDTLIERAETSTQPVLLVSDIVLGRIPTAIHLGELATFAQMQFEHYANVLRVTTPELGPYEALGRGFAQTSEFAVLSLNKTDAQFIRYIYANVSEFHQEPIQAVIDHYQKQIDYFVGLYTRAGIIRPDAVEQARGAVLGQIVGANAIIEGSYQDNLAEMFFQYAALDQVTYGVSLLASMPVDDSGLF